MNDGKYKGKEYIIGRLEFEEIYLIGKEMVKVKRIKTLYIKDYYLKVDIK